MSHPISHPISLITITSHITHYTLHITHYTLHITHYTLHITHYTLHIITHYTLHITHYTSLVTNHKHNHDHTTYHIARRPRTPKKSPDSVNVMDLLTTGNLDTLSLTISCRLPYVASQKGHHQHY